jgi:hypothetical protein
MPMPREPETRAAGCAAGPASTSAEVHLDRDADKIRVVFRARLLLEQRSGVGGGFVEDAERIGYFGYLVASSEKR